MNTNILTSLDGYPFEVRYSENVHAEAVRLAELSKEAYTYFALIFPGTIPTFTAWLLTPDDWKAHISGEGYGMPSYYDKRLLVATDDNPFWQSFGKIARLASPFGAFPKLKKTYTDAEGKLQLRRFFDLLAVHEVAHSFEEQGGAAFPNHCLSEIFANLALHTFIAKRRPSDLPSLTVFPEAQLRIGLFNLIMRLRGYTSLDDFERHYPAGTHDKPMSGANYGWYQVRLMVLACEIFDEGGEDALTRLWAFGQSEAVRHPSAWMWFREHGSLTDWPGRMPAKELAPMLAADVSPRLGKAIAAWK